MREQRRYFGRHFALSGQRDFYFVGVWWSSSHSSSSTLHRNRLIIYFSHDVDEEQIIIVIKTEFVAVFAGCDSHALVISTEFLCVSGYFKPMMVRTWAACLPSMDQGSLKEFSTKSNNKIRANNLGCEWTWQVKEGGLSWADGGIELYAMMPI